MKANVHSVVFLVSTIAMIALGIAGFLVPPMGVIDGSVLHFISLMCVPLIASQVRPILRDGHNFRLEHGDTKVTVGNTDKDRDSP